MGFLTTLFRAATPENPRFNLNSPEAWESFWGGTRSKTGVPVNSESALTYSPWWRGIELVSSYVGKTPTIVYEVKPDGGKTQATTHPAYPLLRWKPNERMTAYVWWKLMIAHKMSQGNGYSYIFRRGDGAPLELLPLDPNATTPVVAFGTLWYVTQVAKEKRKLPASDVLHFKGLSSDGLVGYSVVEKARETLGLGMGARDFAATVFRNGGKPSIVLTFPTKITDALVKNTIVKDWERMNSGIDNAGRTALLDGGLDCKEVGFNPEDNQLLQSREFSIRDIANFTGAPPHKLGDTSRTAYSSLEQENQSFVDDCLDDHFVGTEQECRDKLLTEEQKAGESHVILFDRKAIVRGDTTARTNYLRTATGGRAWMSVNEARDEEGLNPDDGPDSDAILTPLNMGQGGPDNKPEPPPVKPPEKAPPKPPKKKARAAFLRDVTGRMVRRVSAQARAAAQKPESFTDWVDGMRGQNAAAFTDAFAAVEQLLDAQAGSVAGWLAGTLHAGYHRLAEETGRKALAAKVDEHAKLFEASVCELCVTEWIKGD